MCVCVCVYGCAHARARACVFNLRFLNEYFVHKILDKQDFICSHTIKWFQFIIFFVSPYLSQEGQNVIHFDVLEQIVQTIHLETSLSVWEQNL